MKKFPKKIDSKPRSLIPNDGRPIREANFIKEEKLKIVKFLQLTECPLGNDINIFNKMTNSDVKAIFEHFITVFCPTFRLNESSMTPEDRMLSIFTALQYKNTINKSHLTSPSILSSIPFVVAAFDFLRRLAVAHINTHPKSLFPKIPELDISSECVVDALIAMYKKTQNGIIDENALEEFKDTIRKNAGVHSKKEISDMAKNVNEIEELLKQINKDENSIKTMKNKCATLDTNIELESKKLESDEKSMEEILIEIEQAEQNLKCYDKEKLVLERKKEKFEEMGCGEQMKQIEDYQERLEKLHNRKKVIKAETDEWSHATRVINNEIDDVKFQIQKDFADVFQMFPHLINDELREIVHNFKLDHLLNYNTGLRPIMSNLSAAIEMETKSKQELLDKHEKEREELNQTNSCLKQKIVFLENDEIKLLKTLERVELSAVQAENDNNNLVREFQDKAMKLQEELAQFEQMKEDNAKYRKILEENKKYATEAKNFYDADIEFRKGCAEINLQCLQDTYERQQSIHQTSQEYLATSLQYAQTKQQIFENFETEVESKWNEKLKELKENRK